MSDYENDSFENRSNRSAGEASHALKLSVDLMSVRNMSVAANVFATYQIQLDTKHTFASKPPTPVS